MNRRMSVSGSGAATWRHSSGSAGGTPMPGMVGQPGPDVVAGREQLRAVLAHEGLELVPVDAGGVERLEPLGPALLPVVDEVVEQDRGPAHTALEDGEAHVGEAGGHAAHEERLHQAVHALRERPHVVEAVVGHRGEAAGRHVAETAVERHREAERAGFGPHRVVVVGAVETEGVEPVALLGHEEGRAGLGLGDRSGHPFGEADHLEAEVGAVPQPGQRLLRACAWAPPRPWSSGRRRARRWSRRTR